MAFIYGIEVKPKGKRKFKRLSVSMADLLALKGESAAHVLQYCKDHAIDPSTTEWRVINRQTDAVLAIGKPLVIH